MSLEHPVGLVAVILGLIVFHGSIYVVIALNTGWRFGYWLSGATFGGLFVFLAAFWLLTALGPRGDEPRWVPIATSQESISQAELDEQTFTAPSSYPSGEWEEPGGEGVPPAAEEDALTSSVTNCLAVDDEALEAFEEPERSTCEQAQQLLPSEESLPKAEGTTVIMQPDPQDIRFAVEEGTSLGIVRVVPATTDPRVTAEGEDFLQVGEDFLILAVRDPGSLRLPAIMYFLASVAWFAFHLWGLNRAEKRKLSPVAA